jgi:hypothetical protein
VCGVASFGGCGGAVVEEVCVESLGRKEKNSLLFFNKVQKL